jgi:hypothetical protein
MPSKAGGIRSANHPDDAGEPRSTDRHLQPWGFSSLCGIKRGDARLAGGWGHKTVPDSFSSAPSLSPLTFLPRKQVPDLSLSHRRGMGIPSAGSAHERTGPGRPCHDRGQRLPPWGSPAHTSRLSLTGFGVRTRRQGRRRVNLRILKDGHKKSEISCVSQFPWVRET